MGVTPGVRMNEATRALVMAKVMGMPTFYYLNILMSNSERNDKLFKLILRDIVTSRDKALAFLRTLMQKKSLLTHPNNIQKPRIAGNMPTVEFRKFFRKTNLSPNKRAKNNLWPVLHISIVTEGY